jgi:cell shape-determining protein MreD
MAKFFERYFRMGFFSQLLIAFLYLSVSVTVLGAYATIEPSLKSFALHYLPCLLLATIFVVLIRISAKFQH